MSVQTIHVNPSGTEVEQYQRYVIGCDAHTPASGSIRRCQLPMLEKNLA